MTSALEDPCRSSFGPIYPSGSPGSAGYHMANDKASCRRPISPPVTGMFAPGAQDWNTPRGGSTDMQRAMTVMATSPPLPASPPSSSGRDSSVQVDCKFDQWTEAKEKVVTGPYDYLAAKPGKEIRSLLLACFNEWLDVPPSSLAVIDRVVGMLHTASLLIDDIQDKSELRRGRPVAHHIFGDALTINSANHIYFLALQELSALRNAEATEIFTTELLRLHRGQAMDLYWRDTLTCPIEEDYFEMCSNKTGGLFRLAYRLMKMESKAPFDLLPIIELLGVLFQVADDYKNLCSQEYGELKGVGEDLTEGKFSFPVIHSIKANPADTQLLQILQQRPTSNHVKKYAIDLMESTGSLSYTRQVIDELAGQAYEAIGVADQGHGRGKAMIELLGRIAKIP